MVIYSDRFDAAAAMMKMSKRILMDPLIVERKRSIVQSSEVDKDTEDNSEEKADNNMNEDIDYDKADEIPQSWITVPMPPGYVWRLGAPCDKAKGILVRFATKNDKKQERAERFSEYYKNYGNPNKARNGRENSGALLAIVVSLFKNTFRKIVRALYNFKFSEHLKDLDLTTWEEEGRSSDRNFYQARKQTGRKGTLRVNLN